MGAILHLILSRGMTMSSQLIQKSLAIWSIAYVTTAPRRAVPVKLYPLIMHFQDKWDVQLWGFGSLFWNSLMHCLAERPKK
jgi:hypothetical protein